MRTVEHRSEGPPELIRVYVWELPVRITHWLIVGSIVVLGATGFYISFPVIVVSGPATEHFVMGWMRTMHFYAALGFTLAVLSRILWMFLGNAYARWDQFVPVSRDRWRGLWPTLKFYLFGSRRPPAFVGHNPLAGLAYSAVFGLYSLAIVTGFALYAASAHVASPMRVFAFLVPLVGGLQMARFIHHIILWLLVGFAIHHVYSAVLVSVVEANATVESIVSGYKFVPRAHLEPQSVAVERDR